MPFGAAAAAISAATSAYSAMESAASGGVEGDFDTGTVRFKKRERYSFGWTDWRGAASRNPYMRAAIMHSYAMRHGVPTWCYCEICDRETPHMTYAGEDHCVYANVVHPQLEYSYELARYIDKVGVVRPFSVENNINANATRGTARTSARDRRERDCSLATERDCHADARARDCREVSREDQGAGS